MFMALSVGATLLMVPEHIKMAPSLLAKVLLQRQQPTVLQATPSLVRQLSLNVITGRLLGEESHVRVLAFGGEACPSLTCLANWKSPRVSNLWKNALATVQVLLRRNCL